MNETVTVFESNITINGEHLIVALGKSSGKLSNNTILSSSDGKQWRVVDNSLKFQLNLVKLIMQKENEGIFFYDLQGIEHMQRPEIGQELTIVRNVC